MGQRGRKLGHRLEPLRALAQSLHPLHVGDVSHDRRHRRRTFTALEDRGADAHRDHITVPVDRDLCTGHGHSEAARALQRLLQAAGAARQSLQHRSLDPITGLEPQQRFGRRIRVGQAAEAVDRQHGRRDIAEDVTRLQPQPLQLVLDRRQGHPGLSQLRADQPHHQRHGDEDRQLQRDHGVERRSLNPDRIGDVRYAGQAGDQKATAQRQHERVGADQQDIERRDDAVAAAGEIHHQRHQDDVENGLAIDEAGPDPLLPNVGDPVGGRRVQQGDDKRQRRGQRLARRCGRPREGRTREQTSGQADAEDVDPAQDLLALDAAGRATLPFGPLIRPGTIRRRTVILYNRWVARAIHRLIPSGTVLFWRGRAG